MHPFAQVAELEADPSIDMEPFPSTRVADINRNVRPSIEGAATLLSDVAVRLAMNYAASREAIIQVMTFGVGTPNSSFMSSTTPMHTGEGAVFPLTTSRRHRRRWPGRATFYAEILNLAVI